MQNKPFSSKFFFIKMMSITLTVFVILFACSKSKNVSTSIDCSGAQKSFSVNVNPIIQANCATNSGCHGSGSTNGPGELLSYPEIFSARVAIRAAVSSGQMPLNRTLSGTERNSIICWIDNAAPDN